MTLNIGNRPQDTQKGQTGKTDPKGLYADCKEGAAADACDATWHPLGPPDFSTLVAGSSWLLLTSPIPLSAFLVPKLVSPRGKSAGDFTPQGQSLTQLPKSAGDFTPQGQSSTDGARDQGHVPGSPDNLQLPPQ